jgi:hypothetical protein
MFDICDLTFVIGMFEPWGIQRKKWQTSYFDLSTQFFYSFTIRNAKVWWSWLCPSYFKSFQILLTWVIISYTSSRSRLTCLHDSEKFGRTFNPQGRCCSFNYQNDGSVVSISVGTIKAAGFLSNQCYQNKALQRKWHCVVHCLFSSVHLQSCV